MNRLWGGRIHTSCRNGRKMVELLDDAARAPSVLEPRWSNRSNGGRKGQFMEKAVQSPAEILSLGGPAKDESGLFSIESVLKLQKLILLALLCPKF